MRTYGHLSHEEAEAFLEAYVAALPASAGRLRARSGKTGGPTLDGTVDSLLAAEVWFHEQIRKNVEDGVSDVPLWWLPGAEDVKDYLDRPRMSLQQVRLVDEMGAYLAEVWQTSMPKIEWEVYCTDSRDTMQHRPVLRIAANLLNPVHIVYSQAVGPVVHGKKPGKTVLHELTLELISEEAA